MATEAEWARSVERRLAALERGRSLRVGQWTLQTDQYGSLVADGDDGTHAVITSASAVPQSPGV